MARHGSGRLGGGRFTLSGLRLRWTTGPTGWASAGGRVEVLGRYQAVIYPSPSPSSSEFISSTHKCAHHYVSYIYMRSSSSNDEKLYAVSQQKNLLDSSRFPSRPWPPAFPLHLLNPIFPCLPASIFVLILFSCRRRVLCHTYWKREWRAS
jgi:hypothetical protein